MLQYHGNDLDALLDRLCGLLVDAPLPPLVPETLVVPNLGMERWLRQGIAARLGIAANLDCRTPAAFVRELADRLAGAAAPAAAFDKHGMAMRLLRLIPDLGGTPACAPLQRYIDGPAPQLRLLRLATRLAALFDQYLLHRPHWLLAWERGEQAPSCDIAGQEWQPLLWRALVADVAAGSPGALHGAARCTRLLAGLEGARPPGLPARVIAFAPGALPALTLRVLDALDPPGGVHLFHLNPCREYFGDIVSERTRARWGIRAPERALLSETGNRLLAGWGRPAREALQALLETADPAIEDCFVEPPGTQALVLVQRDILDLREPATPRRLADADQSIVFAEAHGVLREVEALHDHLLRLFDTLPGLRPRDIVVMAPDIGAYAGAIDAVFRALESDPRFIPSTIADRPLAAESAAVGAFMHLLDLPASRFGAAELGALLAVPAIAQAFELDADAVAALQGAIRDSGIRIGYDAEGSAGSGPALERNTWRFGLQRLLLGIALDAGEVFDGIAPLPAAGSESIARIGALAEFLERAADHARGLRAARPPAGWIAATDALLGDFFGAAADSAELALLRDAAQEVATTLADAGFAEPLEREVFRELLATRLEQRESAHRFLRGAVNFCQLTPLRSIPFRVVCLLGMNAAGFPRTAQPPAFDLMARLRQPGDPSRRDDDRQLFLESVLSAREHLYLSCIGRDEQGNGAREPALPVQELRDYLDRFWLPAADGRAASARLLREHRLKPFHPDYFGADGPLHSYRHEWLPAARGDGAAQPFCAEPLPPRPGAGAELALRELLRFYRNPCAGFFEQRFGVRFTEPEDVAEDREPLQFGGLERWGARRTLVELALAGVAPAEADRRLLGGGTLPLGPLAARRLADARGELGPLIARVADWRQLPVTGAAFAIELPGTLLRGSLDTLRGGALLDWLASTKAGGGQLIGFWIRHLCGCAAGLLAAPSQLATVEQAWALEPLPAETAREHLAGLAALRAEGLCRPLPLFPQSALGWARRMAVKGDAEAALKEAHKQFAGSDFGGGAGEGEDAAIARAWPRADEALGEEFRALAARVFGPLVSALREPD